MNTEDTGAGRNKAGRCQPYDMDSHGSTSSGTEDVECCGNEVCSRMFDDMCSLRFRKLGRQSTNNSSSLS